MNIWLKICKKVVRCHYCLEDITTKEYMVFGVWREKGTDGNSKGYTRRYHWHAKRPRDGQCCWLVQSLERLEREPQVERRGRKKLLLPQEDREKRLCILRQRARLKQKIKLLFLSETDERDIEQIISVGRKLEELRQRIEPLGGIPKSWL